MSKVGKNIRKQRIQQGMSQESLAEKLHVSRQTVSNYETGKSYPDIDMLVNIAEVLQVEIQVLIYGAAATNTRPIFEKKYLKTDFIFLKPGKSNTTTPSVRKTLAARPPVRLSPC